MIKEDKIGLVKSYVGMLFLTFWGIWSYGIYGIPFCELNTFIKTIIGLI